MTLDHFEQSLLTDLREQVAERTTSTATGRSRRRRWLALPAGGVAAAVAAVLLLQPSGAYAVSRSGDEVVVTIKRLDDAAGLEKALADHGIEADVDYSATALPPPGDDGTRDSGPSKQSAGSGPGPGTELPRISSSLKDDHLTLRIDPDTIPTDAVLHITTMGSSESGLSGLRVMFSKAP